MITLHYSPTDASLAPHLLLEELGVEVIVLNDEACTELLANFIHEHPGLWHEDIGL